MIESFRYRELSPSHTLAPWVRCYWEIRSAIELDQPIRNRVLPDGCADIIVNFGRRLLSTADEAPASPSVTPFVVGAMRSPALFYLGGGAEIFGIRFGPGGARPFFGLPLVELTDLTIDLQQIWPHRTAEVTERLAAASTMEGRVGIVERLLLDHLANRPTTEHRLVTGATRMIDERGGSITIAEIERRIGVSRRQLERAFSEQVGVTPKMYCRVARLHRTLPLIGMSRSGVDWSELVYRCGYYDQSHLIAEMKSLAGLTPTELRRERVAFFQSPHESAE